MALDRVQKMWCIFVFVLSFLAIAKLEQPFPVGAVMASQGSVLWNTTASGRSPTTSAAFLVDTSHYGIAITGTTYYGPMDGESGIGLWQAGGGGYYRYKRFVVKGSYLLFDAYNLYYEHTGQGSIGYAPFPFLAVGVDVQGSRSGLTNRPEETETQLSAGASAWASWRFAALSLQVSGISLKQAVAEGFDGPIDIRLGMHTNGNAVGSQGALFSFAIDGADQTAFCLTLGEEYWLTPLIGFTASVATNPVLIGIGLQVRFNSSSVYSAFVNHPVLGWSKGVAIDFFR